MIDDAFSRCVNILSSIKSSDNFEIIQNRERRGNLR
jgi:hypothetical protein